MAAQFVSLAAAKTHLRIATAPGHPDDPDVQEKLDAAEAAILRYVERSPAGAALVAGWVDGPRRAGRPARGGPAAARGTVALPWR